MKEQLRRAVFPDYEFFAFKNPPMGQRFTRKISKIHIN